jgi:hypothetical protein
MLWPRRSAAQIPKPVDFRIEVLSDSANAPVSNAEVTVLDGDNRIMGHGSTDAHGRVVIRMLGVLEIQGHVTVSVRKVGFKAVTVSGRGSHRVVLQRQVQTLERVVTDASVSSKNYFIGASEIENTNRGLFDALLVLQKLRPEMLGDGKRQCPPTDKLWINGRRIFFGPTGMNWGSQPMTVGARTLSVNGDMPMTRDRNDPSSKAPISTPYNTLDTLLASIKGGHIYEMRYINCWDEPPDGLMRDALYVTLKGNVDWDWRHGSFLVDSGSAMDSTKPTRP